MSKNVTIKDLGYYPTYFDKKQNSSREGVEMLCDFFGIENYTIEKEKGYNCYLVSTGVNTYNHKNDVDLSLQKISQIAKENDIDEELLYIREIPLHFLTVNGMFNISGKGGPHNKGLLKSLEGSPEIVCQFDCSYNQIESLEYGPIEFFNEIEIIKGNSRKKGKETIKSDYYTGYYDCSNNKIRNWFGLPNVINNLVCYNNPVEFSMEEWQDIVVYYDDENILPPRYLNDVYFSDVRNIKNLYKDSKERIYKDMTPYDTSRYNIPDNTIMSYNYDYNYY